MSGRSTLVRSLTWIALATSGCGDPSAVSVPDIRFGKAASTSVSVIGAVPSASPQDVTIDVEISGSGFVSGSVAEWLLNGVPDSRVRTNSTKYVSDRSLVANITIAGDAVPASYDIAVTTPQGKKGIGTEAFAVLPMEELPAPLGSNAYDINSSGVIAGRRSGTCDAGPLPVYWSPDHVMHDLPLPDGFCNASPELIDEAGRIIGVARTDVDRHVLRWIPQSSGYSVEIAITAPDGKVVDPAGMNGAGHFVGTLGGNGQTGFWWSEGTGIVVLPIPSGATSCAPRDVNDLDQIIGTCSFPVSTAVYWESPTAMPVILPRLAGYTAGYIAYALNNHGDAAGSASTTTKGGKYIHAGVYWARSGSTWVAANIGTLGGTTNPTPEAINDAGWIVGADNASGNTRHAFLWRPGVGMTDLGISGAESYAWSLTNSSAAPLIVGQSERNGHFRAIVWKPE